jgi:hypothetical protein
MRTSALDVNTEHNLVKLSSQREIDLKKSVEKSNFSEPKGRHAFNATAYIVAPH